MAAFGLCLSGLAALGAASGAGCRSCTQEGFCYDWLQLGDSYEVELVQHLGPQLFETPPYPFTHVSGGPNTCGAGFDLDVGDTMHLVAERRNDPPSGDECIECYYAWARPEVEGVTFDDDVQYRAALGGGQFVTGRSATLGDCSGAYEIGIAPVWDNFRRMSQAYVATDYVLFRLFRTTTTQPCIVDGSELLEGGGSCWDAWAVRIRDPSGELITTDVGSPPENDAGF